MKSHLQSLLIAALVGTAASLTFAQATLPAGHPALTSATTGPATTVLPAGHPSMADLTTTAPATQNKILGSLTIQAIAGSAGGVIAPNEAVTVELYHRGTAVKKIETKLDASGKVLIPDIAVMPPVQALISINHNGLLQQVISQELNVEEPVQSLQMKVYESTDKEPDWNVAMQHMIVQWMEDGSGAQVIEMISTNTEGDRAWMGNKVGDRRVTMTVPLPAQVDDVELSGGFDEDLSKITDGKLVTGSTLFPGRSEYRLTYKVTSKNGVLDLPIVTPAAVGSLIVFLPADDSKVSVTGLTGGKPMDMGDGGSVRMYRADNLPAGATASISVTGIKPAPAANTGDSSVIKPPGLSARDIAMGGAFFIALIGAGMVLMKKPQAKKV